MTPIKKVILDSAEAVSKLREDLAMMNRVPENVEAIVNACFQEVAMAQDGDPYEQKVVDVHGLPEMDEDDQVLLGYAMGTFKDSLKTSVDRLQLDVSELNYASLLATDDVVLSRSAAVDYGAIQPLTSPLNALPLLAPKDMTTPNQMDIP